MRHPCLHPPPIHSGKNQEQERGGGACSLSYSTPIFCQTYDMQFHKTAEKRDFWWLCQLKNVSLFRGMLIQQCYTWPPTSLPIPPQYIYTIRKKRQNSPIAYRGKWRVGERPRKIHRRFLEQSIIKSIRFNKRRIISGTRLDFKRFLGIYNDILHKHIDMQWIILSFIEYFSWGLILGHKSLLEVHSSIYLLDGNMILEKREKEWSFFISIVNMSA